MLDFAYILHKNRKLYFMYILYKIRMPPLSKFQDLTANQLPFKVLKVVSVD